MERLDAGGQWKGRALFDRYGDKVGTIEAVYFGPETQRPRWARIGTGLFGLGGQSMVPLANAQPTGDGVLVPYTKDHIKDAPKVSEDLTPEEDTQLCQHYGLPARVDPSAFAGAGQPGEGAPTPVPPPAQAPAFPQAPGGWSVSAPPPPAAAAGSAVPGPPLEWPPQPEAPPPWEAAPTHETPAPGRGPQDPEATRGPGATGQSGPPGAIGWAGETTDTGGAAPRPWEQSPGRWPDEPAREHHEPFIEPGPARPPVPPSEPVGQQEAVPMDTAGWTPPASPEAAEVPLPASPPPAPTPPSDEPSRTPADPEPAVVQPAAVEPGSAPTPVAAEETPSLAEFARQLAEYGQQLAGYGQQLAQYGQQLSEYGRRLPHEAPRDVTSI